MKLETLKDIKGYFGSEKWGTDYWINKYGNVDTGERLRDEICKQLKQEAIKWIKELKETDEFSEDEQGIFDNNYNVQEWIKHFFNLTEEDLKDK